jgi:hypothetical protein
MILALKNDCEISSTMATNLITIKQYLKEEGFSFIHSNESEYVETSVKTENYRNHDSEKLLSLVIKLEEEGQIIKIIAPYIYNFKLKPSSGLRSSLFQSLLEVSWKTKFVQFEYDSNDGEIRGILEFPLEDAELTKKQFIRALNTLSSVIDLYHEELAKSLKNNGEYTLGDSQYEHNIRYSSILNQISSTKLRKI